MYRMYYAIFVPVYNSLSNNYFSNFSLNILFNIIRISSRYIGYIIRRKSVSTEFTIYNITGMDN